MINKKGQVRQHKHQTLQHSLQGPEATAHLPPHHQRGFGHRVLPASHCARTLFALALSEKRVIGLVQWSLCVGTRAYRWVEINSHEQAAGYEETATLRLLHSLFLCVHSTADCKAGVEGGGAVRGIRNGETGQL